MQEAEKLQQRKENYVKKPNKNARNNNKNGVMMNSIHVRIISVNT